jgi:exodeoxyribonuclease III
MRLAAQNLKHGGGTRVDGLVELLLTLEADVLVLTEFRFGKTGDQIRKLLTAAGYVHSVEPIAERGTNSALLVSRLPLVPRGSPPEVPESERRWVSAVVEGVEIAGVYMPSDPKGLGPFWPRVVDALEPKIADPFVLIGDFNTVPTPDDRQSKARFTGEAHMASLIEAGWVDSWRRLHPDRTEFTLLGSTGNGFRIDHALLSPALGARLVAAHQDHTPREAALSDHSALVVELS